MPHFFDEVFVSRCETISLGQLSLPSGRIVACDPFFAGVAAPFARSVSPGEYEVHLCRADAGEQGERIALARILFQADRVPSIYEPAVLELANTNRYAVESGLGTFMDELTRQEFVDVMAAYYRDEPSGNYYADRLASEFKESALDPDDPDDAGAWAVHRLPGTQMNIAMFASGLGDGLFESFWGLDAHGEPVLLVTDFRVFQLGTPVRQSGK